MISLFQCFEKRPKLLLVAGGLLSVELCMSALAGLWLYAGGFR